MSKKKVKKTGKKAAAPPPPLVDEGETATAIPVSESVESDVPPVRRHSIEADFESQSTDAERPDE